MTTSSDASQAVEMPPADYITEDRRRFWNVLSMKAHAAEAIAQDRAARAQAEPVAETFRIALHEWAVQGWRDEVQNRPLVSIHRKRLDDFWRQAIRKAGGDPDAIVGPDHDTIIESMRANTAPTIPQAAEVPGFEDWWYGHDGVKQRSLAYLGYPCTKEPAESIWNSAAPTPTASAPKAEGEATPKLLMKISERADMSPAAMDKLHGGVRSIIERDAREREYRKTQAEGRERIANVILATQPPSEADRTRASGDVDSEAVCACKDRPASQCDEEWGPNCDLGNNAEYAQPAPAVDEIMERAAFVAEAKRRGWTPGDFMLGAYAGWLAARSAPAVAEKVPLTEDEISDITDRLEQAPTSLAHAKHDDIVALVREVESHFGIGSGSAQEGQAK